MFFPGKNIWWTWDKSIFLLQQLRVQTFEWNLFQNETDLLRSNLGLEAMWGLHAQPGASWVCFLQIRSCSSDSYSLAMVYSFDKKMQTKPREDTSWLTEQHSSWAGKNLRCEKHTTLKGFLVSQPHFWLNISIQLVLSKNSTSFWSFFLHSILVPEL